MKSMFFFSLKVEDMPKLIKRMHHVAFSWILKQVYIIKKYIKAMFSSGFLQFNFDSGPSPKCSSQIGEWEAGNSDLPYCDKTCFF